MPKGHWKLVLELCLFTEDYNPLWSAKFTQTRISNLKKEIISRTEHLHDDEDKLRELIRFFYFDKSFSAFPNKEVCLQNAFLPFALTSRKAPKEILMLLFCSLAEKIGLQVQVTSSRVKYLLKIQVNNKPIIIDVGRNGAFLQPYEIVELINRGFDFSARCPAPNSLMVEYLNLLKKQARRNGDLNLLTLTHSYLMKYQPFNLKHLSERAVAAYQTGDYKTAIDDIRSYFLYKSPEVTNYHLKKIYKVARRIEKQYLNN
ncbi:MAG: hypothetical protein HRT44_09330 [Bdellovibrionales bacterium]|nr:hypothetical protein [Bdellovibrionales bacterium]